MNKTPSFGTIYSGEIVCANGLSCPAPPAFIAFRDAQRPTLEALYNARLTEIECLEAREELQEMTFDEFCLETLSEME